MYILVLWNNFLEKKYSLVKVVGVLSVEIVKPVFEYVKSAINGQKENSRNEKGIVNVSEKEKTSLFDGMCLFERERQKKRERKIVKSQ